MQLNKLEGWKCKTLVRRHCVKDSETKLLQEITKPGVWSRCEWLKWAANDYYMEVHSSDHSVTGESQNHEGLEVEAI